MNAEKPLTFPVGVQKLVMSVPNMDQV